MITHEPDIAAFALRNILFKDGRIIDDRMVRHREDSQG